MRSSGIRWAMKHGHRVLLLDFYYTDKTGARKRFRRVASVQTVTASRAESARLQQLAAETGSPTGDGASPSMTFKAFVDGPWKELYAPRLRPATRIRYDALLEHDLLPAFGRLQLEQVGAQQVLELAATLASRGVRSRPQTSLVSTILRAARDSKVLARMPELPAHQKAPSKLPDCPSLEEVHAALAATRGWLRLAVALAAFAGLRSGEVRALEVRDVDLGAGVLHIRRAMSGAETLTPKGDKERDVPIDPELEPLLRAAVKNKLPLAHVIITRVGTTPTRQNIRDRLARVLSRHHLRPRSFHAMRHHFCSSLLRRGASLEAVRIVAGHTDIETTARYLHATVDEVRQVMGKVSRSGGPHVGTATKVRAKSSQKRG
jgi:integrase